MKKAKRGVTLIELMVVLSLVGLVATMVFSLIKFGNRSFKKSTDEYTLQTNARLVAKKTNDAIKYATAVFAIPGTSFEKRPLTDGWSYIGVMPDGTGTKIVNYVWNPNKGEHGGHDEIVILEASDNVKYSMIFSKLTNHTEDKQLSYEIEVSLSGGSPMTILSKVENLNALQVIDYGSGANPSKAIAYRSDERPVTKNIKANVAMVLDNSGSMSYDMGVYDSRERMVVLKEKAKVLVDDLAQSNNVDICLVPFSSDANIYVHRGHGGDYEDADYVFYNAQIKKDYIIDELDDMGANGGTNTGDGMRRAYYALVQENQNTLDSGKTPLNYMIILVDGETTYASGKWNSSIENSYYYTGKGNYNKLIGNGNTCDDKVKEYDKMIGNMIKNNGNIKVYLIGMCSDISNVRRIAAACGDTEYKYVYTAENAGELTKVFNGIKEDILNDLWYLDGPKL